MASGTAVSPEGKSVDDRPSRRDRAAIWLLGFGIAVPAMLFARRYPLAGHTDRLTDIGFLADYQTAEFIGYVLGISLMFVCYVLAIVHCKNRPPSEWRTAVFVVAGIAAVAFVTMYPVNAIDIFLYSVRSRLWTEYGVDPIAVVPDRFSLDPWHPFSSGWGSTGSPYGPLWNLIAAPVTLVAGDRIGVALAGFKALAVLAFVACGLILDRIASDQRRTPAALIFLWNPLVLWEGVGNGHNDLVMLVPVLLAVLAWKRHRLGWMIPCLIAAALIKYVAVVLIPIALVAIWRDRQSTRDRSSSLAAPGVVSVVLVIVAFWPFFDPGAIRQSLSDQGSIMLTSPGSVLFRWLDQRFDPSVLSRNIRAAGTSIFSLAAAVQIALTWRRPERVPRALFEIMFAFLAIATWNFRAWYVIWIVALVAILPAGWSTARAIAWSAGGLAGYALFIWGWEWWGAEFERIEIAGVLLMFGPVVIGTALEGSILLTRARNRRPLRESRASAGH